MKKYQQAAISIAFLTMLLTSGTYEQSNPADSQASDNFQAKQEKILDTFENNDYEGWRRLIGKKSEIGNYVDKNDFEKFITARTIARAGEYDQAIRISQALERELRSKLVAGII